MNVTPLHPNAGVGAPRQAEPIETLAGNKALSEEEKVTEASRQFEALILRQILAQARKTVFRSSMNQDSMSAGIYQDMVTTQLADAISQSGSLGLARSLQLQLGRQTSSASAARPHGSTQKPTASPTGTGATPVHPPQL